MRSLTATVPSAYPRVRSRTGDEGTVRVRRDREHVRGECDHVVRDYDQRRRRSRKRPTYDGVEREVSGAGEEVSVVTRRNGRGVNAARLRTLACGFE